MSDVVNIAVSENAESISATVFSEIQAVSIASPETIELVEVTVGDVNEAVNITVLNNSETVSASVDGATEVVNITVIDSTYTVLATVEGVADGVTINVGQVVSGGAVGSASKRAYKSLDETKTLNDTISADGELTLTVEASTNYIFRGVVFYSAGQESDLKISYGLSGGATGEILWADKEYGPMVVLTEASEINYSGVGGERLIINFSGLVKVDDPGSFDFKWAQGTSNASDTTILSGSFIDLIKI